MLTEAVLIGPDGNAAFLSYALRVDVDVTEWLGSEQFAYAPFDAPPEVVDRLCGLAREQGSDALRTQLVASVDPASRLDEGGPVELWLDPVRMHLFDPASGENLTQGPTRGGS